MVLILSLSYRTPFTNFTVYERKLKIKITDLGSKISYFCAHPYTHGQLAVPPDRISLTSQTCQVSLYICDSCYYCFFYLPRNSFLLLLFLNLTCPSEHLCGQHKDSVFLPHLCMASLFTNFSEVLNCKHLSLLSMHYTNLDSAI
jgi:hypothetical protein